MTTFVSAQPVPDTPACQALRAEFGATVMRVRPVEDAAARPASIQALNQSVAMMKTMQSLGCPDREGRRTDYREGIAGGTRLIARYQAADKPSTASARPPADRDPWAGRYTARSGSYHFHTTIAANGDGTYRVQSSVGSERPACIGELSAVGRVLGNALVTTPPERNDSCVLRIRRTAKGIDITENSCSMWHGAACEFTARLTRVR